MVYDVLIVWAMILALMPILALIAGKLYVKIVAKGRFRDWLQVSLIVAPPTHRDGTEKGTASSRPPHRGQSGTG